VWICVGELVECVLSDGQDDRLILEMVHLVNRKSLVPAGEQAVRYEKSDNAPAFQEHPVNET